MAGAASLRCAPAGNGGGARTSPREADLELMQAVGRGEARAQATLAERVTGLVHSRVRTLARSRADAEDATQDSLVEILRSAKNYRGEGSLEGWCERIAVRTTLRAQRRESKKRARLYEAVEPDTLPGPAPERRRMEEIPRPLETYLAELSTDRREVMVMRHVQDCSIDEIATRTGVSPNTVKDRLRVARRQLRKAIHRSEVVAEIGRGRVIGKDDQP